MIDAIVRTRRAVKAHSDAQLQTLQWGPQHGYGIVQALHANSGEVLQVETGSYPAAPAGTSGLVCSECKQTEQPARQYYRITRRQETIGL
jgi:DNA-binding PadR family transcriptional regulator